MILDDGAMWIWNVLPMFRETCQCRLILLLETKAMIEPINSGRKGGHVLSKFHFPIFTNRLKSSTTESDAADSSKHS
jgi:hypothetical protein